MEFWIYDFGDLEKGIRKRHPLAIGCEQRNEAKQSHIGRRKDPLPTETSPPWRNRQLPTDCFFVPHRSDVKPIT